MGSSNTFTESARYTDYTTVVAALTAKGKAYQRPLSLHTIGSDGDDASIIGMWGWDDNAVVANRVIVPYGPIRFSKVTSGGYGLVSARTSDTVFTCAGQTLPASASYSDSRRVIFFDTTGAVELCTSRYTLVGNDITLETAAVGSAVGDQVYFVGQSEFTIGSATALRDIRVYGGMVYFASGVKVINGSFSAHLGTMTSLTGGGVDTFCMRPDFTLARSVAADGQGIRVGGWDSVNDRLHLGSIERAAGADRLAVYTGTRTVPIPQVLVRDPTAWPLTTLALFTEHSGGGNRYPAAMSAERRTRALGVDGAFPLLNSIYAIAVPAAAETIEILLTRYCSLAM